MYRLFLIPMILFCGLSFAELEGHEEITGFDAQKDLPILNENFRHLNKSDEQIRARLDIVETMSTVQAATQAEMESATLTTVYASPGTVKYHPGMAKAWCVFDGTATGTNAPTAGHNVTSVTRNGGGDYTINFTTAFSSANYATAGSSTSGNFVQTITPGASTCVIYVFDYNGTQGDAAWVSFVAFGDQ